MTAPLGEPGLPPYPPPPSVLPVAVGGTVLRPLTPAMTGAVRHHERMTRRQGYRSLAIFALVILAPALYLLIASLSGTSPPTVRQVAGAVVALGFFVCLLILPVCVALWRNVREAGRRLAGPCVEYTGSWTVGRRVLLLPATAASPTVRLPLPDVAERVLAAVPWGAVTFLPEPPLLLAVRDPYGTILFHDAGYQPAFGEWYGGQPPRANGPPPV